MRIGWKGAGFVIGALMLPIQVAAAIDGAGAADAGEAVSDREAPPRTSARSRAGASASASAPAAGEEACESRATASASASVGDRQVSDYDEQTAVGDDGSCSASSHATARAAQDGSGE